jgi:hypothetical protein
MGGKLMHNMHTWSNLLVGVAILAVTFVLFMGLANMLRGGSPNFSQKLMRWRVGLQFLAIIIIMGVLYFRS